MLSALMSYAHDHDGRFPEGVKPLNALSKLYPTHLKHLPHLAGVSGDEKATSEKVLSGIELTEGDSSWIYHPGFTDDDLPQLAIIWESKVGLGFNGKRTPSHIVGFADGSMRQVMPDRWNVFCETQSNLRAEILIGRE